MNFISRISLTISLTAVFLTLGISQSVIKIMPLGNSMTEGWTDGSVPDNLMIGYRYQLKKLLTNAGYSTDFVGSQSNGGAYFDGTALFDDCQHAGISGTRDNYIARMLLDSYDERWDVQILNPPRPYLDEYMPDIILLDVGTNDISHENEVGDIDYPDCLVRQKISLILDRIDQYEARTQKECIVFLGLIINRRQPCYAGSGCARTSEFNAAIESMALARIANGDKIVIVDLENEAGFTYISGDDMSSTDITGLHPNTTGYNKMANLWFSKLQANYNTKPTISCIPNQSANEGSYYPAIDLDDYVSDIQTPDQNLTWTTTQLGTPNLNISINATTHITSIIPTNSQWNGNQTVVFTVTDLGSNGKYIKSSTDTVVFTTQINLDPPLITNQSVLSVNEDTPKILSLSDFTILDPDSDPSTFQLHVLAGTNYSVDGKTITPATNFNGILNVNIAVSDNSAQGPTYSAIINVVAVNDKPVFASQPAITIDEDEIYRVLATNMTVSDPDNMNSELTVVMEPGLNYTIKGDTVVPNENFYGTLQVSSYIIDPLGATSSTFNLSISVISVNDPPMFVNSPDTELQVGEPFIYAFNATDPDNNDVVSISVMQKPEWITYYETSNLLAGVPKTENSGMQQLIIRASDGQVIVDQSFILNVKSVGVIDYQTGQELTLYPNPASNKISITGLPNSENVSFKLYNIIGSLAYSKEVVNNFDGTITVDDLHVKDGIYFYLIEVNTKLYSGKVSIAN